MINADMPQCFKQMYPSTSATGNIFQLQEHKYFQGIGRSSGVITFVSKLYAGSISDKDLSRCSGILEVLEPGDSVMV